MTMLVWRPLTQLVKRYSVLAVVPASNWSCVMFYSRLMTRQFSLIRKCFLVTRLAAWRRRTTLKGSLRVSCLSEQLTASPPVCQAAGRAGREQFPRRGDPLFCLRIRWRPTSTLRWPRATRRPPSPRQNFPARCLSAQTVPARRAPPRPPGVSPRTRRPSS